MARKKKNRRLKETLVRVSITYFIKKPSFITLFMMFICLGIYYLEQYKLANVPPANSSSSEIISSNLRVIDGDTIVIDNIKIRLQGIDAPELKQKCKAEQTNELYQIS